MIYKDKYPVWGVMSGNDKRRLACPNSDGTVSFSLGVTWSREEWKEFKAQADELFDIAERGDEA